MLRRAFATLEVKAADEDRRVIEGIASSPITDRMGDIVDPEGATYKLPLPLLWQHRSDQPIGQVTAAKVTKTGIKITAQVLKSEGLPPGLAARVDEAWALIKTGIVQGLSIGFRAIESAAIDGTWGIHFQKWEWLELSAVTIAANGDASISTVKSLALSELAALGQTPTTSGATDTPRPAKAGAKKQPMKTTQEQIAGFEAQRQAKHARMNAIMAEAAEQNATLDAAQQEEYDGLESELDGIDQHLKRLHRQEERDKTMAVVVKGSTAAEGSESRGGAGQFSRVQFTNAKEDKGLGFARYVICNILAYKMHRTVSEIAKARYPNYQPLHDFINKAAVPGGTTTQTDWAAALVEPMNLASEFVEWLRPQTIIGQFGTGGRPDLRRVPFNVRVVGQQSGGTGYWVGEGAPKPLTSFKFGSSTLTYTKVAAIAVITEELARFSSPSAEPLVRDALRDALVERLDRDFIDPAISAIAGVRPASITNGLAALTSAGTSADNVRTDLGVLLNAYVSANQNAAGVVLIMPNTLALGLSMVVNALGQPEFPGISVNGGNLQGIPVITSQYAANESGGGNLVVAVNAREVFLADDGDVTVDASREASLQMLDNPTNNSASGNPTTMVSMFQTDSIALRAERFINWSKRRTDAVVYMDDVNWGSIGSPS